MHTLLRQRWSIALLAGLLACTTVHAQADGSLDGWPDWVQDAMQTELRRMKPRAVEMPTEAISTKLPGKLEPVQAVDDSWYFRSDIKAGSPLECYIYTSARDLATLANVLAELNIEAVANANNGAVGVREPHYIDAGAVSGVPYIALEWIYTLTTEAGTRIGFTKVRAAAKGDMAFVCAHNYLGYRESFAKIFSDFVENTEYETTSPSPYYEEIVHYDVNGFSAGVAYYSFTEDDDGDTEIFTGVAMLMPVDASTVMASDSITITHSTSDGDLIDAIDVTVENGDITSNLTLKRNDNNGWVSGGTLQGKDFEVEIDGALSPASDLRLIAAARDLFLGDETSVTLDTWIPSADPTQFLATTLTRDDAEVKGQANGTLGPLSFAGRFDEDGNMIQSEMSMGPVTVKTKRIWQAGSSQR